jgi:LmbE family N-acetylglucosaminyl deacetylase
VATLVTFHAHPDDEAIATGGTMAKAAAAGHEVVLVSATRGELGEPVPGVLDEGEPLWRRRVTETEASAKVLGAGRVEFLGYEDSGMMGESTNENPACFWQADLDEAAGRLAAILTDVGADVLTVYDDHGGYGHPDHIQVHRVGVRAAELAGVAHVYESTMNRDQIARLMAEQSEPPEGMAGADFDERQAAATAADFGSPEALITHRVDVRAFLEQKRQSMEAHASQIAESSFFLAMPAETFAGAFGQEWFIERGRPRSGDQPFGDDLFAGLDRSASGGDRGAGPGTEA